MPSIPIDCAICFLDGQHGCDEIALSQFCSLYRNTIRLLVQGSFHLVLMKWKSILWCSWALREFFLCCAALYSMYIYSDEYYFVFFNYLLKKTVQSCIVALLAVVCRYFNVMAIFGLA